VSLSLGDIKTGALMLSWDKPEGNLFTALAVSGMKMARAWLGLCNGTGELLDMIRVQLIEAGTRREIGKWLIHELRSTGGVRRAERLVVVMKGL
jgi:hypothetical protein